MSGKLEITGWMLGGKDLLFLGISCNPRYFRALTLLASEIPSAL